MSSLPAASSSWLRIRHTSPRSSPYLKVLCEAEWTTAVEFGSWLDMASKTGSLGKVEAILENVKPKGYMVLWLWCSGDPDLLSECCDVVVIVREVERESEGSDEDGDVIFRVIADRQTEGPRFIVREGKKGQRTR